MHVTEYTLVIRSAVCAAAAIWLIVQITERRRHLVKAWMQAHLVAPPPNAVTAQR